jgi:hypothetical protein
VASKIAGKDWGARLPLMGAALVALWAAKGSASALLEIASRAEMSETTALPVALDMTGLVAALVIRRRRGDWLAWATLVVTVGISTAMQVATAPADLVSQAAHGVVPLAALVSFELAMRVAVRDIDEGQADEAVAEPAAVEAEPEAVPQVLPAVRVARKRVSLNELVPVAEQVAAELVGAGKPLTWQALRDGVRAAGYACGDERARTLATLLRTSGVGA